jgi:hypothetical protein
MEEFQDRPEGGMLADPKLRRTLESLETSFDAALARAEDEAASDLAFSLLQGRTLLDLGAREGPWDLYFGEGRRMPLTLVGRDFVAGGSPPSVLVPAARAVLLHASEGEPARESDAGLIEELRGLAGFAMVVEITTSSAVLRGHLVRVGPDHVAVRTGAGEAMAGFETIHQVVLTGPPAGVV